MAATIRAIVVDDQPVARDRLMGLLALEADVEVVATCNSGMEAVRAIRATVPNLVFLDMQMPELDGLGVVEAIGVDQMPLTVFVTAFDEYAVRAFDAHALDYLLKPFARPRFQQALQRARRRLDLGQHAALSGTMRAAMSALRMETAPPHPRLVVKSGGRVTFLDIDSIDWVEAEGNYARLHVGEASHVVRHTMTELLPMLGTRRFFRVHRSRIVNVDRVKELRVAAGGDYDVVLTSGTRVSLSRAYRDALQARLAGST